MHPVLRLLSILAVLGASFAVIPTAHAAKRQVPFGFYGVMWDGDIATAPAKQQDRQWALMARSGVESVRTVFSWALAQPTADGPLDFTDTDRKVAMASRRGVALLPVVLYTPHWAARSPDTFGSTPKYASDYAAFMRQLVLRYGPRGSFWAENPKLPRRPIRDWQLWNEPHFDFYWHVPGEDKTQWASEYVELLAPGRARDQAGPTPERGSCWQGWPTPRGGSWRSSIEPASRATSTSPRSTSSPAGRDT